MPMGMERSFQGSRFGFLTHGKLQPFPVFLISCNFFSRPNVLRTRPSDTSSTCACSQAGSQGEQSLMDYFRTQLKQVLRRLVRTPMFTAVTLITLAAGVGANTVVFSVLEGILLKPLSYPRSEELIGLSHAAPGINIKELPGAPSNYFIYRDQNRSFQDIAMMTGDSDSVTGVGEPEQVRAMRVTDGMIPILG